MMGLATGVPKYKGYQKDVINILLKAPGKEKLRTVLERIYSNTRITSRYMAIPDFTPEQKDPNDENFFPDDGSFAIPIQNRLEKFKEGR